MFQIPLHTGMATTSGELVLSPLTASIRLGTQPVSFSVWLINHLKKEMFKKSKFLN